MCVCVILFGIQESRRWQLSWRVPLDSCDTVLLVEERPIFAHSTLLRRRCPVLLSYFDDSVAQYRG